jgi:putative ABC transport system permease protein
VIGAVGVKLLVTDSSHPGIARAGVNARLLMMAVAIAVVVGVISGIYPAWRSSRLMPSHALHY